MMDASGHPVKYMLTVGRTYTMLDNGVELDTEIKHLLARAVPTGQIELKVVVVGPTAS